MICHPLLLNPPQVPCQEQGGRGGEQGQARDRRVRREEEERRARVPQEDRRRARLQGDVCPLHCPGTLFSAVVRFKGIDMGIHRKGAYLYDVRSGWGEVA